MNIFNAPLPGTTLQTITEEWKVLSGFHDLLRGRMKLEAEYVSQLRLLQDSIDPNWSKFGVWTLIAPVFDLWSSQMDIMEEFNGVLTEIVKSCPGVPSPDEPEEGIIPSSRYVALVERYKASQDCQTAASSRQAIAEMQRWYKRNRSKVEFEDLEALPATDRNYRKSVVAQRSTLRPIVEWHSTRVPEKLESHVRYAEETQTCLRDYLVKYSISTSNLVKSISTAQKRLAGFSSLVFIDPSQRCFENESSHPALQPAVYLNYCLGGVPAEPVLGVMSYFPKLLKVTYDYKPELDRLSVGGFLQVEKESANVDDVIQKLQSRFYYYDVQVIELAFQAIGPLLPIGEDAIRRYKTGIKREEIALLLKPFPIENCRMAFTAMTGLYEWYGNESVTELIFGSRGGVQLLLDIWRKWDFDNHRPLPRDVVRTRLVWNNQTEKVEGGGLVFKKTGLAYDPPQ